MLEKIVTGTLLALGLAGSANATTTYQFDSANYSFASGRLTTAMHLTWTLQLDNPISVNATTSKLFNRPGAIVTWNDGANTFTADIFQTLTLTTDTSGQVTEWEYSFSNASAAISGNNLMEVSDYSTAVIYDRSYSGYVNSGAGSFTVTTAVPEPETYALMLLGLTVVGLAGKRSIRRNGNSNCQNLAAV